MDPYQQIQSLLTKNNINFDELEHGPVFTSEEAARVRNLPETVGAKSLLLRLKASDGEKYILAVIPGDRRLNNKSVRQLYKAKDVTFAKPEKVEELVGCKIGAVYPFGSICNLEIVADPSIKNQNKISFNPARHDRSITIDVEDWLNIETPAIKEIV